MFLESMLNDNIYISSDNESNERSISPKSSTIIIEDDENDDGDHISNNMPEGIFVLFDNS